MIPSSDVLDIEIQLLLEAIFLKYRADFRTYSSASVRRRLALAVEHLGLSSVSQLQERVLRDGDTYLDLLQYLTIPTSEMFRDPKYFRAVREKVIPFLKTYPSVKLWIAGCSTGEEIYSFAILLAEEDLLSRTLIYATDINPLSLKRAEEGVYPLDRIAEFTKNYQQAGGTRTFSDYYRAGSHSVVFERFLRERVVFADHSLATDTSFAEVQMVSCRNVLIYFNRELQNRAFDLFHQSLSRRGFIGLGSKETLRFSPIYNSYEEFPDSEKIYQQKIVSNAPRSPHES